MSNFKLVRCAIVLCERVCAAKLGGLDARPMFVSAWFQPMGNSVRSTCYQFWFPPVVKFPRSMDVDLTVSLTSGMCEDKQVINDVLNALHVVFLLKETKRN